MESSPDASLPVESELHRFLDRALFRLELATLVALLLITLLQPTAGRTGIPTWGLVLGFLVNTLLVKFGRNRVASLQAFRYRYSLNLLVTVLVYFLGAAPGGPLFVLFFMDVACATASLTLRGALVYTIVTMTSTAIIDPTFPQWAWTMRDVSDLGARLIMLALFGVSTAILRQRIRLEEATARSVRYKAERLELLDRVRTDFMASVSHELQTPLTAVRAAVVLVGTSAADRYRPDEQELLDNARRNIDRLSMLINNLVTQNQLETGTLRLEPQPCDLRAIATDAIAGIFPLIREKRQLLEVDLPEPLRLLGDQQQLEHVVVNLLTNAHRHTPPGTRITVSGYIMDHKVLLSVSDNGPGIPAEELEEIFKRFYQLETANGGSGLGLAIARKIVQLHGGRVWAESQIGEGTTFYVALHAIQTGGIDDAEAPHCRGRT
jgi:signal transduction histidine kinase